MNQKGKNPFRISYYSLAIICCMALCVAFLCINYMGMRDTRALYDRRKAEMMLEDWENQLKLFEEIGLKIAINNEYQPFYFERNKYYEKELLDDFKQYSSYSALTEECFLYYGGDIVFHSAGSSIDLNVYLNGLEEQERESIKSILEEDQKETEVLSFSQNIYVLIPFRASWTENRTRTHALLGFVISKKELERRFQIVSGGLEGNVTLYKGEVPVYSTGEEACTGNERDAQEVGSSYGAYTGQYTICYVPERDFFSMTLINHPLQLLLVLFDVVIMLSIANVFARRSWQPIQKMSDRYQKEVELPKGVHYENTLEEIDYMFDSMLRNKKLTSAQIVQKQEMLHKQFFHMLINGSGLFRIQNYLEKLQIRLPGSCFYVISISFEGEEEVTDEFLNRVSQELEGISSEEDGWFVYAVCDYENRRLSAVCSITEESRQEELTEYVCEVAESFGHMPVSGVGNVYRDLSRMHASWLESMDIIHNKGTREFIYDSQELRRICAAMAKGDMQGAVEGLSRYGKQLENGQVSQLMLQYIFSDFLSEVTRLARKFNIELSKQDISLIVASNSAESFIEASESLIRDFCLKITDRKNQTENDRAYQIYEYMNAHFAEYDLSIEKIAADLDVSTAVVRQAILKHTGKMYKDYLIYLRIEYAKELLQDRNLSVADICQRVGYGNISYFIKLFKEINGMTPAKYRETNVIDL